MGIDWNSLWGKATDAVEKGLDQAVKTGVPALQSSLEKWGIDVLQKQNVATQAKLDTAIQEVLKEPAAEGSFGAYLQDSLRPGILKEYGPMILAGVAGILIVGMLIRK